MESHETTVRHESDSATTVTSDKLAAANSGDVEAQWRVNLERDLAMAGSEPDGHDGYARVRLSPIAAPQKRRLFPEIHRSMSLVDGKLRDVFRQLTTGNLPWPLFLWGPAGTGKTRASLCLCDIVAYSRYGTVREACDAKMAGSITSLPWESFGTYETVWPPLVVLDELGARLKVGDLEYSVITEAYETRERHGRNVAIYISNLGPNELAKLYDDRVASRVLSGTVFKLDGADRRQKR